MALNALILLPLTYFFLEDPHKNPIQGGEFYEGFSIMKHKIISKYVSFCSVLAFTLLASCASQKTSESAAEIAAAERVNEIVQEAGIDTPIDEEVKDYTVADYKSFDPNGIVVHFEFERSDLNPTAISALNRIVDGMKKDPLARITIQGHADKQGTKSFNERLSARRAKTITTYLLKNGIEEERLNPVSYGASVPVEDTPTIKAYKKNRRGDFNINYGESAFGPASK